MRMRNALVCAAVAAMCLSAGCNDSGNEITGPAPVPVETGGGTSQPPADGGPGREGTQPTPPVPPERDPHTPVPPSPPPDTEGCRHSKAQWAVGERATQDLLERARLDAGARTARFLRLNQPVTLEYQSWRLNVVVTDENVVHSVICW